MNENTTKLVEALRSGDYNQTQGRLHDDKGFCCLGVACDISGLGEWARPAQGAYAYVTDSTAGENENEYGVLTPEVRVWLGWNTSDGWISETSMSLARLNDDGAPFNEIADIIEERFDGLAG